MWTKFQVYRIAKGSYFAVLLKIGTPPPLCWCFQESLWEKPGQLMPFGFRVWMFESITRAKANWSFDCWWESADEGLGEKPMQMTPFGFQMFEKIVTCSGANADPTQRNLWPSLKLSEDNYSATELTRWYFFLKHCCSSSWFTKTKITARNVGMCHFCLPTLVPLFSTMKMWLWHTYQMCLQGPNLSSTQVSEINHD